MINGIFFMGLCWKVVGGWEEKRMRISRIYVYTVCIYIYHTVNMKNSTFCCVSVYIIHVYLTYKTSYSISGRHRLMRKLQVRWIDKLEIYSTWQVLFLQKPRKPAQRQTPFRMTRTHQYEKNTQPTVHQRKYPNNHGSNLPPPPKQIKLRLHSSLDFLNWWFFFVNLHIWWAIFASQVGTAMVASLVAPSPSCQYSSWSLDLSTQVWRWKKDVMNLSWIPNFLNRMNTMKM